MGRGVTGRTGRRFVVLSAGWSGGGRLAAALGRSGRIRFAGSCLRRPVRDPARHLRRRLDDGPVAGALVRPDDIWLVNGADPQRFVDDLRSDGITLLTLRRRIGIDRGLSRVLSGLGPELVPRRPVVVDPAAVVVHAHYGRLATDWFDEHLPSVPHLVFEDDVADPARGGAGVAARFVDLFGLEPWDAPPSPLAPTTERLWAAVVNADELRAGVEALSST